MRQQSIAHFWSRVHKTESCWLWTGPVTHKGYGRPTVDYRKWHAHQLSWVLLVGPVPTGLCVLHNCPTGDNKRCVRPSHLFLGTTADNNEDRHHKDGYTRGDRAPYRKLTEQRVRAMVDRYVQGGISHRRLAELNEVSEAAVQHMLSGRTWGHVTGIARE